MFSENKRNVTRLLRKSADVWQLRVEDDKLITRNISNISPTGLSFKAPLGSKFESGQRFRFQLCLNKEECFEFEGRIVWVKKADDVPGAMQQLGVQFENLPAWADASIMKQINDSDLEERRTQLKMGERTPTKSPRKKLSLKALVATIAGTFILASLVAAFILAIYIHQQSHPEESIAYKFNKALFERAVTNTGK